MTDAKKKILFLCTGNAARSQMSEALARIDYPDLFDPVSAGSRSYLRWLSNSCQK